LNIIVGIKRIINDKSCTHNINLKRDKRLN
jgi:hypothetical protein